MANQDGIQALPPKMAAHYAECAKRGEATKTIGKSIGEPIYIFHVGNQEICLISTNPPQGYIRRLRRSGGKTEGG